jgi:hypothetical protein
MGGLTSKWCAPFSRPCRAKLNGGEGGVFFFSFSLFIPNCKSYRIVLHARREPPLENIAQGNWTTPDAFLSHDVFDGYWHHLAIAVEDTKSDALL